MLSDAHAHLEGFPPAELKDMLEKARQVGVVIVIASGMSLETSRAAVKIANQHDLVYASIGVHPARVRDPLSEETLRSLRELALENEKVLMIGETGLDFSNNPGHREAQLEVFRQHIRLARQVKRPLVLHDVGGHADLMRVLNEEKAEEVGGADHYFAGTVEMARDFLDLGFHVSFGRLLARPEGEGLREVAKTIPIDRILTETDCLVGHSSRPADVGDVAEALAKLKGVSREVAGRVTTDNLRRLTRYKGRGNLSG